MSRIIIAGGGTGGHIFPAIAIANAIKQLQPAVEILFVGAKNKMEMQRVPQAGYAIKGLDIAGYDRSSFTKNILLPYKLIKSFWQVQQIIDEFKPDAAIGVGGYSSFPVLRYAQRKGIKTFIHESNSFAGKSNILLGKKATKIFVASNGMNKFFPAHKTMITGNPVRKNIVSAGISKQEALHAFGLNSNRKTVLITGGSLGSKTINEVISRHIHEFLPLHLQVIWQTGKATADSYVSRGKGRDNVWVDEFITDMDKAFAAADIVVSRAGAMSVSEAEVAAKPVIFVPYPFAAEDHQTSNAKYLVDKNAALMVKDSEANTRLFETIITLAKDEEKQKMLSSNIKAFAVINADEIIAREILSSIK